MLEPLEDRTNPVKFHAVERQFLQFLENGKVFKISDVCFANIEVLEILQMKEILDGCYGVAIERELFDLGQIFQLFNILNLVLSQVKLLQANYFLETFDCDNIVVSTTDHVEFD